jgi:outer membrane protein TolC
MRPPATQALLAAILIAAAAPSSAQEPPDFGAELPALLRWLDENNPELRSIGSEAEAARARTVPAGALADPMFQVELRDISRDDPNVLPARVGSTKYTISQQLPWWGKRDLRRQVAEAEADAAGSRVRQTRVELRSRVKTAYSQYFFTQQAARQTEAILGLLRDVEKIALNRYSTGLVPQQDVVKAQLEQTALKGELIKLAAQGRQSRARLNAVLARPADAALAEPRSLGTLPDAPFALADLQQGVLDGNPQIKVLTAQIAGAQQSRELARKNWYPDFNVGVSSIQVGNRLDAWELMFELNIPLQRETRRAQEREAAAVLAAAQDKRQASANQLEGELGEAVVGFNAAQEQERLLHTTLLPQAELTFHSALASYETGKVDFATLLDAQRQILRARLDRLNAQVEQRIRLADIERILGEE